MATAKATIQKQLNLYLEGKLKISRPAVDLMFMRMAQSDPETWMPALLAYLNKGRSAATDAVAENEAPDPFDRGGR
jgi:hypothetical protein